MDEYDIGEYIVNVNGDQYEIGKIKSLREDGAFVFYHEGDTAAKTPFDHMHKLSNGYSIKEDTLGGAAITEERKVGEWIIFQEFDDGTQYAQCTQCKEPQVFYPHMNRPKYCPNCGVKIVEHDRI